MLLAALAAYTAWPAIQDAIHRRQVEAVLNEKLAGHMSILRMRSRALRRVNSVYVYTPPGYAKSHRRYPVVYLLHGCPGAGRDWFVKARAHETAERMILAKQIQPMILVSADAFGPDGPRDHSEYLNSVHNTIMVEDYFAHELPRFVDSTLRTIPSPNARAMIGLSSGGYGAINLGTRHQDVYHILGSHSGYFDPDLETDQIERMLGPEGPLWDRNDPHKHVSEWRSDPHLRIYLDCGDGDELLADNQQLHRELTANGIKHVLHVTDGGHRWSLWADRLQYSLKYANSCFKELAARRTRRGEAFAGSATYVHNTECKCFAPAIPAFSANFEPPRS